MKNIRLDKIAINVHARRILLTILEENPILERILRQSDSDSEAIDAIQRMDSAQVEKKPGSRSFLPKKRTQP
jgi:lysine 2,3-aminomutase